MKSLRRVLAAILAAAMVLTVGGAQVFAEGEYPMEISEIVTSDNAVTAVNAKVNRQSSGLARALVSVYEGDLLVSFGMSEPQSYEQAETVEFAISPAVAYTDGQKVAAFIWSCDVGGSLTMIPLAEEYVLGGSEPEPVEYSASWSFDDIAVGTTYANGETAANANGDALTVGVAEKDTVNPTIKERTTGDNYLEFNDSTEDGSAKQDSWTYTAETPFEGDVVSFSMDVNKNNTTKDTILFRVYDTANTTGDNSYGSDGRSFELKTGDSGSLAFVDYYSAESDKAAQVNVPYTYSANKWFSVRVEYERNENVVYVYAGETADTCKLCGTYALGKVGSDTQVDEAPILAPDKVAMFTPGGGSVVIGVDNIGVESSVYKAKEVPVTGTAYITYSDDMRNKPEAYDSSINASVSFTKKGEMVPAAVCEISADGTYSASLMSGEVYEVSVEGASDKYTLSELSKEDLTISKKDDAAEKNILFVNNLGEVEYKSTLEVGADKEYNTVNKALSAVRKMNRTAGQTVTIVIDPGVYEEQLLIDVEDIVLKAADPTDKPTIQWYYGIGYVYYSADASGLYNADCAAARTTQRTVSNWGATIRTTMRGFRAENINFINTFNKYITQAELDDGVVPGGKDAKYFDRSNPKTEVRSSTAKERAAAIYAGGSEIELYRCSFSSSQDTFGTSTASLYAKECEISGNTDYICGGDNAYFENCSLLWTGYSDMVRGGEITACKINVKSPNTIDDYHGYYFKDCTIGNTGESGMRFPSGKTVGNWGRPWGNTNCKVIFDHTTVASGAAVPSKWGSMSGNPMTNAAAAYVINGLYKEDDPDTDLTASVDNPKGTYTANGYTLPEPEDFFGGWEPVYYTGETSQKIAINKTPAENGSFSFKVNGASASRALEGDVVEVVTNPDSNYETDAINVVKTASGETIALDENNSFIMPAEEVTVTVTFKAKSMGIYADWKQGQTSATDNTGEMENVEYQGKDALHIINRNVYKTLDAPVSSGKAVFKADMWLDPTVASGFRIYLENEKASFYQDSKNDLGGVIAEVINSNSGAFCTGPDLGTTTSAYSYSGETAGWFTITITLDYDKKDAGDFITVTVKNPAGTEVVNKSMAAISGVDTTLNQIRLVARNTDPYFADISFEAVQ